ncbi:MAG TPA: hypothetical protein EYP98_09250 [Planctomycetes bacterium]|nr:hypothetical protein [Planctomycetota bacterium]
MRRGDSGSNWGVSKDAAELLREQHIAVDRQELHVVAGNRHRTPWAREGAKYERLLVDFFLEAIRAER